MASPAVPPTICNTTGCITTRYITYNTLTAGFTTFTVSRYTPYATLITGITYPSLTIGIIDPTTRCIAYSAPHHHHHQPGSFNQGSPTLPSGYVKPP